MVDESSDTDVDKENVEFCYGGGGDGIVREVAKDIQLYRFQTEHAVYVYRRTEHKTQDGNIIFKLDHVEGK